MRQLLREDLLAIPRCAKPRFDCAPIQAGFNRDPWMVAVASMLLCRTRRSQMEPVVRRLFEEFPGPAELARARAEYLEQILRPLGLQRNRARQLSRFSAMWFGGWRELRELPGVGVYVADAVGLLCFGDTDVESGDPALRKYADQLHGVVERQELDAV